ncbi:coenzyme F420-0:L-glutamate ligase/coenzyme F420-1:gamma-L-glutamate ligase [Litorivivens lipolytica]|uniref:Coenzyme F420-0:L-glutamate ligase/coenzyme F420-1:gamma-L-glutamate ligase n=1 Tax=Litorivivens lipolytica TaxID=1524264 RepID=A0A7W4W484_9GAMM|nr:coenzyme F420-0:L-glutamate ligase/coenzyme F420-1:gamma-L-glutamate ligase [Litorivivens lipolytica]
MSSSLNLTVLPGFPLVEPGDDLAALIVECCERADIVLQDGDVLALAQKIVSKAENRYVWFNEVEPSEEAIALAEKTDKDPRQVELILRESKEVVRHRPGAIIVEHREGYVHANAGIDASNIHSDPDNPRVLLLPEDSNASARTLRDALRERLGVTLNILINDSAGRAWRNGTCGFALGSAGFEALVSRIGDKDLFGRPLEITQIGVADELAAAASFLMGQADEGAPVVLIRGAQLRASEQGCETLIRPKAQDMFR